MFHGSPQKPNSNKMIKADKFPSGSTKANGLAPTGGSNTIYEAAKNLGTNETPKNWKKI